MNFLTKKATLFVAIIFSIYAFNACSPKKESESETENKPMTENILMKEWTGPYGGVPAFDLMKVEDIKEAMTKSIDIKLSEIDEIANNQEPATFENTIEAMERSGK